MNNSIFPDYDEDKKNTIFTYEDKPQVKDHYTTSSFILSFPIKKKNNK